MLRQAQTGAEVDFAVRAVGRSSPVVRIFLLFHEGGADANDTSQAAWRGLDLTQPDPPSDRACKHRRRPSMDAQCRERCS